MSTDQKQEELTHQDRVRCCKSDGVGNFDSLAHPVRSAGHRQQLVARPRKFQNVQPQRISSEFNLVQTQTNS